MLELPPYAIKNHEMQYCAKVMRANFDEIRALFSQFFVELSPDISNELSQRSCESSTIFRRKFENAFEISNKRFFEEAKYRRFFAKRKEIISKLSRRN